MKFLLIISLSILGLTTFGQKYIVNANASSLNWTGHAQTGGYSPKGTLHIRSGTITLNDGKLADGKVIVDMASLKQDNAEMQEHLRGKDFFDVAQYPEATLIIDKVNGNTATGRLTIKGQTQILKFNFTLSQEGERKIARASASIDRTKYGIKYNSASYFQDLGSYAIRDNFEIEVTLQLN